MFRLVVSNLNRQSCAADHLDLCGDATDGFADDVYGKIITFLASIFFDFFYDRLKKHNLLF